MAVWLLFCGAVACSAELPPGYFLRLGNGANKAHLVRVGANEFLQLLQQPIFEPGFKIMKYYLWENALQKVPI